MHYPDTLVTPYLTRFVTHLTEQGVLPSPELSHAFSTIPRHRFVSSWYERQGEKRHWQKREAPPADQAHEWLTQVYSDTALVTQLDEQQTPTSSSSQPSVMATMLEHLALKPGHCVLEIGVGSGYNAALLACLVEDPSLVTSLEIDPTLAEQARSHLEHVVGPGVTIQIGNGLKGFADNAPYDRIIATASYHRVPSAWLEQLQPGGKLVMNLRGDLGGGLLHLVKEEQAGIASGQMIDFGHVAFMALQDRTAETPRSYRNPFGDQPLQEALSVTEQDINPAVFRERHFLFFLQWMLPHTYLYWKAATPTDALLPCLVHPPSQSRLQFLPTETPMQWKIEVRGTEPLWRKVWDAYQHWLRLGKPGPARYQVHLERDGRQWITLGEHGTGSGENVSWELVP